MEYFKGKKKEKKSANTAFSYQRVDFPSSSLLSKGLSWIWKEKEEEERGGRKKGDFFTLLAFAALLGRKKIREEICSHTECVCGWLVVLRTVDTFLIRTYPGTQKSSIKLRNLAGHHYKNAAEKTKTNGERERWKEKGEKKCFGDFLCRSQERWGRGKNLEDYSNKFPSHTQREKFISNTFDMVDRRKRPLMTRGRKEIKSFYNIFAQKNMQKRYDDDDRKEGAKRDQRRKLKGFLLPSVILESKRRSC